MSRDHFSVAHFENYLAKQDLAYRTIKGYLDDLRFFSQWYEEIQSKSIDFTKVTSFEIQAFRQYLVNAKRQKVSAVNRRIQALKRFFNWAHEQGFIPSENPVEHLRFMRRQSPTQPAALNKTEVHNLLRVAGQSSHGLAKRNYVILQLMLQCGLRASEIINLKYKDIKLQSRSGTLHVVDGKGHKSREVPMNVTVRRALTHYLEGRLTKEPDGPLIYSKRQQALSLRSMQSMINSLSKRAKLKRLPVSAHTLRHTFAVNYLQANPGQLVELAQLMGHDSLNTTAIYTKSSKERLAEAVEKSEINIYGEIT